MPQQFTLLHFIHFSRWRLPLVVLSLLGAGLLLYILPLKTTPAYSFYHIAVLLAAAFYSTPGGVIVATAAGLLSSLLFVSGALEAGALTEVLLHFSSLLLVGVLAGCSFKAYRRREGEHERLIDEAIDALLDVLDSVDCGTARHSQRVANYAVAVAKRMDFPPERVRLVRRAALLHDVGKLSIPPELLNKPAALTPDEWKIVKNHPLEAVRIIDNVSGLRPVVAAVRHHHERLDGQGYPDGVQGSALPLEARIISVADAFDAMTSERTYRTALRSAAAYAELRRHAGSQFDPAVVEAFIDVHQQRSHPRPRHLVPSRTAG